MRAILLRLAATGQPHAPAPAHGGGRLAALARAFRATSNFLEQARRGLRGGEPEAPYTPCDPNCSPP